MDDWNFQIAQINSLEFFNLFWTWNFLFLDVNQGIQKFLTLEQLGFLTGPRKVHCPFRTTASSSSATSVAAVGSTVVALAKKIRQSLGNVSRQVKQVSHEKNPGCLGYIGDCSMLPSYMGIIIHHGKDPYETTSMMESRKDVFHSSGETGGWF